MNLPNKIQLTQVQETLFITLHAKAIDHRSKNSILNDAKADEILQQVDYDFRKMESFGNDNLLLVRAKQYDEWLREFLKANHKAVVVNLGCGLDTRVSRINPPAGVFWFDVDYPEVIQLREKFYSNREGYQMIASSITDAQWLTPIPRERPTMIIADGVLEYLSVDEAKVLLNRITDHFSQGQIVFDVMSGYAIQAGRSRASQTTGALQKWAVNEPGEVDRLNPKLNRTEAISLFSSPYLQQLPWAFRGLYRLVALMPRYRNMIRLLRYEL